MVSFEPVRSHMAVVATEPTELEYLMVPRPFLLDPVIVKGGGGPDHHHGDDLGAPVARCNRFVILATPAG